MLVMQRLMMPSSWLVRMMVFHSSWFCNPICPNNVFTVGRLLHVMVVMGLFADAVQHRDRMLQTGCGSAEHIT